MQALAQALSVYSWNRHVKLIDRLSVGAWVYIGAHMSCFISFESFDQCNMVDISKRQSVTIPTSEAPQIIIKNICKKYPPPAKRHLFLQEYIWVDFYIDDQFVPESYWNQPHKVIWSDGARGATTFDIWVAGAECCAEIEPDGTVHLPGDLIEIMSMREAVQPRTIVYDLLPGPIAEEIAWFGPA